MAGTRPHEAYGLASNSFPIGRSFRSTAGAARAAARGRLCRGAGPTVPRRQSPFSAGVRPSRTGAGWPGPRPQVGLVAVTTTASNSAIRSRAPPSMIRTALATRLTSADQFTSTCGGTRPNRPHRTIPDPASGFPAGSCSSFPLAASLVAASRHRSPPQSAGRPREIRVRRSAS